MSIWEWTERVLAPPGIRRPRRRSLYRIGARVGEQVALDVARSKREFFAFTASDLDAHAMSSGIPRLPVDTDASYRWRLVQAGTVLGTTGEIGGLRAFLDAYIPGRWRLMDSPRNYFRIGSGRIGVTPIGCPPAVIVSVYDLTVDERMNIEAFLDWFLGTDIEYRVLERGYSPPSEPLSLNKVRNNGGSTWLAWHLRQLAQVTVDLLPDDAFAVGTGDGVGQGRVYRGSGEYVVVRCSAADRTAVTAQLALLIQDGIEIVWEEEQ